MEKKTLNQTTTQVNKSKILSKQRIFFGISFIVLSGIMILSFISYLMNWQSDQSQNGPLLDKTVVSANLIGKLGNWFGKIFIFDTVGLAGFVIAFLVYVIGTLIMKKTTFKPWKTIGHSLFFICWLPIFIAAISKGDSVYSGAYGYQIMDFLSIVIGDAGVWIVIIASLLLYFILEFNLRPSSVKSKLQQVSNSTKDKVQSILPSMENFEADEELYENDEEPESTEKIKDNITVSETVSAPKPEIKATPVNTNLEAPITPNPVAKTVEPIKTPNQTSFNEVKAPEIKLETAPIPMPVVTPPVPVPVPVPPSPVSVPKISPEMAFDVSKPAADTLTMEKPSDDINFKVEVAEEKDIIEPIAPKVNELVEKHGLYDHKLDLAKFQMPSINLLRDYGNEEISINKEELEENKNKIVGLLKNFNVGISEIKATIGPTVTLYEIVPEAGIRVAAIKKLQDDIALNLSALGIRIIAPMPGKGTIGIEVPRKNPTMVSMRSVLSSQRFQNTDMDLPVVFGKTISNEIFMADLAKMPHLLMAGATGQGKSVGINAILASLLYKKHPSELKFVMVDPKKVELSLYSKIERHYLAKLPDAEEAIITDTHKVINTLNSLCVEMDTRYDLLKNAFCKNIKEYNKKFSERKLNPENGHRYLPYIVLVVDEFADLIMTAGKEVELPIARLAQLARAVGIHLIVATQRPSVNVITGMIKANFPARAAFRVISSVDSRTILDSPGADQLIGKGDMLFFNGSEILRLQCAFIDTPEVEQLAEFIGEQKGYPTAFMLPEYSSDEGTSTVGGFDPNEKDQLFEEAARIIVSTQQGSTSMLQRQLKLGYNRAGRIMDQLEASGVVGGFNGAKAREVLISDLNSLEQFLEDLRR